MKWNWAFFTLLGVNVAVVIVLILLLTGGGETSQESAEREVMPDGQALFSAQTTIEQINAYIDQETDDSFLLEAQDGNYVFTNTYELFGLSIDIRLNLQPSITDNGNIRLVENGFSVGMLELPASTVLQVIDEQGDLPEWVHVNSSEGAIDIRVNEIDTGEGLYLIVDELSNDGTIIVEGHYSTT